MTQVGLKFDTGKPKMATILSQFVKPLEYVVRCGEFGIDKYGLLNWREVADAKQRYENAGMRHYMAHCSGEIRDPETGIPHLAHAAWNCLAALYFYIIEGALDNE
jgi:hypothetical protein